MYRLVTASQTRGCSHRSVRLSTLRSNSSRRRACSPGSRQPEPPCGTGGREESGVSVNRYQPPGWAATRGEEEEDEEAEAAVVVEEVKTETNRRRYKLAGVDLPGSSRLLSLFRAFYSGGPVLMKTNGRAALLLQSSELGQAAILPRNKGKAKYTEYPVHSTHTTHTRPYLLNNRSLTTPSIQSTTVKAQATMKRLPGSYLIGFSCPSYSQMTLCRTRSHLFWLMCICAARTQLLLHFRSVTSENKPRQPTVLWLFLLEKEA